MPVRKQRAIAKSPRQTRDRLETAESAEAVDETSSGEEAGDILGPDS